MVMTQHPSSFPYPDLPTAPNGSQKSIRVVQLHSRQVAGLLSTIWEYVFGPRIVCSMRTVSFDDNPEYAAISYTWEPSRPRRKIIIDGHKLLVGKNVYDTLLHLRHPTQDRHLWIDAICINQLDNDEKSTQVAIMDQIYKRASIVFIWLGMEGSGSNKLIDLMEEIGNEVSTRGLSQLTPKDFWELPERDQEHTKMLDRKLDDLFVRFGHLFPARDTWWDYFFPDRRSWYNYLFPSVFPTKSYHSFCNRSWFRRVWVIQELAVGRDPVFICGKKQIKYEQLENFMKFVFWLTASAVNRSGYINQVYKDKDEHDRHPYHALNQISSTSSVRNMMDFRNRYQREAGQGTRDLFINLERVIFMSMNGMYLQATKEVDKIYALLGISPDSQSGANGRIRIEIDYNKPAGEVFKESSRAILMNGHVDMLGYCQPDPEAPQELATLPSWVCTWHERTQAPIDHPLNLDIPFRAGGNTVPVVTDVPNEPGRIRVKGFIIGEIVEVAAEFNPRFRPADLAKCIPALREFNGEVWRLGKKHQEDFSDEDFCRLLLGDVKVVGMGDARKNTIPSKKRFTPDYLDSFNAFQDWLNFDTLRESLNWEMKHEGWSPDLGRRVNEAFEKLKSMIDKTVAAQRASVWAALASSVNRQAWRIEGTPGYIGLGPLGIQPGDDVCIMHGSTLPIILRATASGAWKVIGQTYLHKGMDGELTHGLFNTRDFQLC